jgi:hypothetical protein
VRKRCSEKLEEQNNDAVKSMQRHSAYNGRGNTKNIMHKRR